MNSESEPEKYSTVRHPIDTTGFAHAAWQMDELMERIESRFRFDLERVEQEPATLWKAAICPHDDYACASWLYPAVLRNLSAKAVIIFGVAHKARQFSLEQQLIFDDFKKWQGPYGEVSVSPLRDEILSRLPEGMGLVHREMQTVEHSVEAMLPFLQYYNREVEIISILVPYSSPEQMHKFGRELAKVLANLRSEKNLHWGKDLALLISSDAVHYGDEDWGGNHYAPFGTDSEGTAQAMARETEIMKNCFTGELTEAKIARFSEYTLNPQDFHEYQWTWCGRYSIPTGLYTALNLQKSLGEPALQGIPMGYASSISQPHIEVDDLGMGLTNTANRRHWVGYPAIGLR